MDGVVKGEPVPKIEPPVGTLYHLKSDAPEAVKVSVPVPQRVAPVAVGAASPAPRLVREVVAVELQPLSTRVTFTVYTVVPAGGVMAGVLDVVELTPVTGVHA